jgi:hypothetical protein
VYLTVGVAIAEGSQLQYLEDILQLTLGFIQNFSLKSA